VANYLLTDVGIVVGSTDKGGGGGGGGSVVVELGAGTGLVSLAVALGGGASRVIATDYERLPLDLLDYGVECLNNGDGGSVGDGERMERLKTIETSLFDIRNHAIPLPIPILAPSSETLVVAADILYDTATGLSMAQRTVEALKSGCRVIVGCSPGRKGRPIFLEELRRLVPALQGVGFMDVVVVGRGGGGGGDTVEVGVGSGVRMGVPSTTTIKLMDLKPSMINGLN